MAGVEIKEDRFVYSHHAKDPAYLRLCNAFDIVRVHKFGDLDDKDVRECEVIAGLSRRLVEENARLEMDQNDFKRKYDAYSTRFDAESARIDELKTLRTERLQKADAVSAFMFEIHERENLIEEFSEKLWLTMIETVTVFHDGSMVFKFKNGMEVRK